MNDAPTPDETRARERYARVTALFDAALDVDFAARAAFLTAQADGDAALHAEVLSLLEAHGDNGGFLETSVAPNLLITRLQRVLGDRYRVVERIAEGGMATVFRAEDVRHGRQVAVKVLLVDEASATTPMMTSQRFLDEIRVTAALQHPNLMPLFDSGSADGMLFYVMPFVDGESLRARLQRTGPLTIEESVALASAIADGLEHAHAAGIVHRDLKPENIMLRDGRPLLCDFGIALALAATDGARRTQAGMVIGTPQYMSPEQAAGADVLDARSDVYSLGAILYEMLVGDPPHVASTTQGVLAKVWAELATPVHQLRAGVSVALSDVIARALSKQAADRFPSALALREALTAAAAQPVVTAASAPVRRAWPWLAASGVIVAAAIAFVVNNRPEPSTTAAVRFAVAPIKDAAIGRAPTLTPDGSALVYAGAAESGRKVFVRQVNELEARALEGTHGALATTVSPDGRRIAFTTSDDRLIRIGIDGSDMTDLGGVFRYTNAAWLNDSAIVVDTYGEQGLTVVPAAGGAARAITRLDTLRHDSAHLLPFAVDGGASLVFIALRNRAGPGVQTGELCVVPIGASPGTPVPYTALGIQSRGAFGYVDGWLLYVRADGRALMAVRFDAAQRVVRGTAVTVLEQEGGGIERAILSRNGTLLYSRLVLPANAPVIVDTAGHATPVRAGLSGAFMNPRVSRDGRKLVVQRTTADGSDAWLYDLATGTERRLTNSGAVLGPAWDSGGRSIVYVSSQDGRDAVWSLPADGNGVARRTVVATGAFAASPSPAADVLLFQRRLDGPWSIWRAGVTPDAPVPVLQAAHDAFMPTLSPDGHWLAWAASESGRYEVYMRPFPGTGNTVQVSQGGGTEPAWAPDGTTIFYRADRRMMAATLGDGETRAVTNRRALFVDTFDGDMPMPHRNYDVMPDGRRFVMIAPSDDRTPQTIVALDWLAEFRMKVAAAGR